MTHTLALARRSPVKVLVPLLLSVAVCQAYAADPQHGANGAADHRTLTLTSAGNLSSSLSATGANGGNGIQSGGGGGAASAVLDLTAAWLASGNVSAQGGNGGSATPANAELGGNGLGGSAIATGVLRGAGATGSASARGGSYSNNSAFVAPDSGNATASLTALTTGAQAVNLSSAAYAGLAGGASTASVYVDSGVTRPAAGNADINASATAIGSKGYAPGDSRATLTLYGTGKLSGTSLAQTGASADLDYSDSNPPAAAHSTVLGITSGKHDVTLTATATAAMARGYSGAAYASASGQSGSGKVVVTANAGHAPTAYGVYANAHAVARSTAPGGSSYARANAGYSASVDVLAEAYSVGSGGSTAVAVGSSQDGGQVVARSTATDGGNRSLVAESSNSAPGIVNLTSYAAFGGSSIALPVVGPNLDGFTVVTAGGTAGLGAGMQSAVGGEFAYANSEGRHAWQQNAPAGHLWINFMESASGGEDFGYFGLYISNNGTGIFSREFYSVEEANLFFNGGTLDLGPLAAGMQNLVIRSELGGVSAGYAFNYMLAVPEPTEWLLMLSGLTLVMVAARRRSKARLRAPDLLHAEAG